GSGLERTYLTGAPPRIDVDHATYKMILDAARGASFGLRERLRPVFGQWGSPIFMYQHVGGGYNPVIGFAELAEMAAEAKPNSADVEPVYPLLSSFGGERPVTPKNVTVGA